MVWRFIEALWFNPSYPHHVWENLSRSEKLCCMVPLLTSSTSVFTQILKCSFERSLLADACQNSTEFSPILTI
ncbi:hypothetical protein Bca52824_053614 [Brassica carinata]|uniref:Uncharacterized protein n=1 Tax=Brassica carinata TaxID=52824 RepID=A0A8X7R4H8_BRACI|nr:hypothetical protein Bca52824_053614 [Brassica carinata]